MPGRPRPWPTAAPAGRFTLWEPGELLVVGLDAKPNDHTADPKACDVRRLEVKQNGRFQSDDGTKCEGPQRLRLLLAVPPGMRGVRFRYYFELFGNVKLP